VWVLPDPPGKNAVRDSGEVWVNPDPQGGSGRTHILRNIDCSIQGVMKEVFSAKNSTDSCTIAEETNESLVKARNKRISCEWHILPFLTCCYIAARRILLRSVLQRVAHPSLSNVLLHCGASDSPSQGQGVAYRGSRLLESPELPPLRAEQGVNPNPEPSLLQCYCTSIAQYTTPPPDHPFVCHPPYNSGNGNIV